MKKLFGMETKRMVIRPLKFSDLELTLIWRNKDRIRNNFFNSKHLVIGEHLNWFKNYLKKEDDYIFIMVDKETKIPFGQLSIYNIDWKNKTAEFGRLMIGEDKFLGKGLSEEATKELIKFVFKDLKLNTLYLDVIKENEIALRVYEKCGFKIVKEAENFYRMEIKNDGR